MDRITTERLQGIAASVSRLIGQPVIVDIGSQYVQFRADGRKLAGGPTKRRAYEALEDWREGWVFAMDGVEGKP